MERLLAKLARAVSRRKRVVLAVWGALVIAAVPLAIHETDRLSGGGWDVPGSSSAQARTILRTVPGHEGERLAVFVWGHRPDRVLGAAQRARDILYRQHDVRLGRTARLAGGSAAVLPFGFTGKPGDAHDFATKIRRRLVGNRAGVSTRIVGEAAMWSNFESVAKRQLASAEAVGLPIALGILVFAFGTLVAAAAPIVLAIVSVLVAGALTYLLAGSFEISMYVTNTASMIGIGVGVDYALFVVSRYRQGLASQMPRTDALSQALASAGTAVLFSGATVAVSLISLFVIDVNAVRSLAIGAIGAVSIAVIATLTLLPALLAAVGRNIERLAVRRRRTPDREGDFWLRWSARVMSRPVWALTSGIAVMLLLAAPVLGIHSRSAAFDQLPLHSEVRAATTRLAAIAGPGALAPINVLIPGSRSATDFARRAASLGGVQRVRPPVAAPGGRWQLVDVIPAAYPESDRAEALRGRLRALAPRGTLIGGVSSFSHDVDRAVFGGIPRMILLILGSSFVLLAVLLRSLLLPLKAILMNTLSVLAAYGVLVVVFQWGWVDWTGYASPEYVDSVAPVVLLAITFGLSMDYEVFLLTRIRERWLAGSDTRTAVGEGLALSARTITAAAVIMVVVFAAFALAGSTSIRELGIGLAVAIALDATIIRLVVVPAAMRLLGDWNWWLPFRGIPTPRSRVRPERRPGNQVFRESRPRAVATRSTTTHSPEPASTRGARISGIASRRIGGGAE